MKCSQQYPYSKKWENGVLQASWLRWTEGSGLCSYLTPSTCIQYKHEALTQRLSGPWRSFSLFSAVPSELRATQKSSGSVKNVAS